MGPYHGFYHILLLSRQMLCPVLYAIVILWDALLLTQKTKQTNKNKKKKTKQNKTKQKQKQKTKQNIKIVALTKKMAQGLYTEHE